MNRIFIISILIFGCLRPFAQNHHERFESIDVIQYIFEIRLNDSTNVIEGHASVIFNVLKPIENITLDLASINPATGNGMKIKSLKINHSYPDFTHDNNVLTIEHKYDMAGTSHIGECFIEYSGIPEDGLIISKNRYGERTFFGDNWPDRAKHWLPTVDHPSDKAPVIFSVIAPKHYKIIANGKLDMITDIDNGLQKTIWKEAVPLPTKLMVIGVADFEVGNKETYNDIQVSSWVFTQNKEQGFENYKYTTKALKYFSEIIGPYSYEKLVHVQSKTRYGGMENASCIFYHENTATSNHSHERLFAHEVAHQWFGNSVTEQNWHHVWLSEGFATYLTHVYNQHFYGDEIFREGLKNDRERIINYSKRNPAPIIDTTITDYTRLLNTNSYEKASWFLHMLRIELGDEIFFKGLQKYYVDYQNLTALTGDFQNVMETISGKDLDLFFKQWLWQPGHPVIDLDWKQKGGELIIFVKQSQPGNLFSFPLVVEIQYKNDTSEIKKIDVNQREIKISVPAENKIEQVKLDPEVKLLFERI